MDLVDPILMDLYKTKLGVPVKAQISLRICAV